MTNVDFPAIINISLKVLRKRSTHPSLKERIIHGLKGDCRKALWKVALEPDF